MNEEKRLQRRQRLMDNKAYQTMQGLTRYMDRYYLDALIGVIPGWGDAIAFVPLQSETAKLGCVSVIGTSSITFDLHELCSQITER